MNAKAIKTDKILNRVRALLALADHPGTPPAEADTAMEMANSLMSRHAIDEALARAAQSKSSRRSPQKRAIKLATDTGAGSGLMSALRTILHYIAETNRCKMVHLRWSDDPEIYGMSDDVEWVEMLYTQTFFTLVSKINPRWDSSLGYDENVYNHKVAGFKWKDINRIAMSNGEESRENKGYYHKMKAAYMRHAKKIGDTNLVATQSHKAYRESFVNAFKTRLIDRLIAQAEANKDEASESGAEIALRESLEDVLGAMYADHPELSPEAMRETVEHLRRIREAEEARKQAEIDAMTPIQRAKYYDAQERRQRRQAESDRKYWNKESAKLDRSAHARGKAVANSVQLSRTAPVSDASETSRLEG